MLYKNATCATGACCDLNTCRPKKPGTLCRSSNGECDLPEYCTGESEYCPNDVFKRDTVECGKGKAYCYEGACRSRTDQCRVLWGISGNSSDECYSKNENGSRHGNCGYDRLANEYVKCRSEDIYCGMLHCRHTNEKLEFGMENVAVLSHSFLNHENRIVACRTAIVDLGLESMDPGLTPNGAKCGEGKMCVNQRCLAIESVIKGGKGTPCENDCNGHGVCNSEGHCHCDANFAPPDCIEPGPGGSVDSGPSRDPNGECIGESLIRMVSHDVLIAVSTGFAMFLIIVCGVLLPLGFLIFCYFYCRRQNGDRVFIFKRPFNMYVDSFLERINCGGGFGRCRACFRSKGDSGGGVKINSNVVGCANSNTSSSATNSSVPVKGGVSETKTKKIEIKPGELISCTNSKLVSSSKCLNVET